jgi:hypothetical protein
MSLTNLQNPVLPNPTDLVEIDWAIQDLQMKLDSNLPWLSHNYARAYRHLHIQDNIRLYFPEIYIGGPDHKYYRPTPDNDKSGMCFFVVGKETPLNYEDHQYNYLQWPVGIVFSVNLELIDDAKVQTELFTQNLIRDVRRILTTKIVGSGYRIVINEVVREFSQVYSEWSLQEKEDYAKSPQQIFRFNLTLTLREDCPLASYDKCSILTQNISHNEILSCLLPTLDFTDTAVFDSLTPQQKADLQAQLCP